MLLPLIMLFSTEAPLLLDTRLYKEVTYNCISADLENWRHPTKKVLLERGVILKKVELCNDKKYPIYHVRLPYDPTGKTQDYFHPLYTAMYKANGKWPYAIVDDEGTIVYVTYRGNTIITPDYEFFSP